MLLLLLLLFWRVGVFAKLLVVCGGESLGISADAATASVLDGWQR